MSTALSDAANAASTNAETAATAVTKASNASAMVLNFGSYEINLMSVMIITVLLGLLFLFYRIQKSDKLDFADMITKDGRAVSLTKMLQLVGGITATWVIIKMTSAGTLTEAIFGLYLTYVGAIEGYSKFVAAKYGYTEKSVKDAVKDDDALDPSMKPPKE